jgi:hypothetical protein
MGGEINYTIGFGNWDPPQIAEMASVVKFTYTMACPYPGQHTWTL